MNAGIYTAKIVLFLISSIFIHVTVLSQNSNSKDDNRLKELEAPREFRAAWVATVANINWPSKPGLSTDQQKKEAIDLLDFLKAHNYNAVIFQVRPQADALYQSELEPWSYYLTGEQGKAPDPLYDPLTFWTEAAHDRGLELHVWLNPYRAHHVVGGPVSDYSMVKKMPETVLHLKEGYWWFDPSLKATQDHGVKVVMDIVKRYDIDGVHFDDYFYPYPSYNNNEDFPDTTSWNQYIKNGGTLSRGDWRRNSVNVFIERLYKEIKEVKPHVKFGLSPFGIWRPGYPESVGGFDQYDQLYADARLWLQKGWVDYFAPQLYWPISRIPQSFPVLLGWWAQQNDMKRHLWPGISIGRDTSRFTVNETLNQIMITRGMLPGSSGVIHWSLSSVIRNPNMGQMLMNGPYAKKALVPASPWLSTHLPDAPDVRVSQGDDSVQIQWTHQNEKEVFRWVVYAQYGAETACHILNRGDYSIWLAPHNGKSKLSSVSVTAVDRFSNESIRKTVQPNVLAIIPRSGWGAAEARPYKSQTPLRITVHHEGGRVLLKSDDATLRMKNLQKWCMGPDRNWVDVPYHFLIAPDGTVFEGRDPMTAGETATEYDPSGHLLISFLGNYQQQEPDEALMEILARLIARLCKLYNISPDTIATHRDYSKMTTCPGKYLYPYFQDKSVKKRVKKLLGKR